MDKPDEPFNKTAFLEGYLLKHRELGKRQREYKKLLSSKLKTRNETIIDASYENTIDRLEEEKNDLRAQIWVAAGATHMKKDKRYLAQIRCHVECQENLAADITKLKTSITNMEREISRVSKQIYNLNRLTVPEQQHQAHVAKVRKKMAILENSLEVGIRQECGFTAANAELREQLIRILNHRTFFNDSYTKMVQKLNSDKKYLIDLIEYALNTFDGCIDVYEKIDKITKRESKERELRRIELQSIMRKVAADADNSAFVECKGRERILADLPPKEYRRRDEFRRKHNKKINLYNSVLKKILDYTNSSNVEEVIEKFQQQESLYYSFFNYANEMSYHITLLNNSVNRLFEDIIDLKRENTSTLQGQIDLISSLEQQVRKKQAANLELHKTRENNDTRLENLLQGVEMLCDMCSVDTSPLSELLGDHTHVNLVNVERFLRLLETRVQDIVASVYVFERQDEGNIDYVVKQIEKICELPTDLNDIVLTQQCPECAEGEAFNMDDGGDGVAIHTIKEAKQKLYEKITQPEMQYRLHSISQCRLPRSRMLAARRNV
ncbi:hypothetical protein AWZ03_006178 [Drosophila navojoa]|uniref:ODAD1 central coiled coil region domain-containing protein n=1 Tax=Drosophila navojoa TaxID=7232 RepID=A0A484BHE2_DRONA|nr:uncharacterized protein LOC108658981 [Drosophila navojoa]TDG47450.1 hypothetical protein AWZ03_006178 [Drosophila navojoa]